LIYNVRNPEQDQTAIFRQIWQGRKGVGDGLFDNPNGQNGTCLTDRAFEKKLMYGQDKMCPDSKKRKVRHEKEMAPRKPGLIAMA
jgi:hypothetical protein